MSDQSVHLHHIKLEGFKSIKSLELDLSAINILIGANGAGKSNFISLFTFLRNLAQGKLQTYVEQQGYANAFFHFGTKQTSSILIELDVGQNGYHAELVHSPNTDTLLFKKEYCTYSGSQKTWTIKGKLGESGLLPGSEAASAAVRKYTRDYLQHCRIYHFHDTSSTASFKQATSLEATDFLHADAGNLAAFLYRLRDEFPKNYNDIVATIRTVAPFFHDFYLQPRGAAGEETILLRWLHRDHDNPFSANQLSDGTARFICLATLFLQPPEWRPKTLVLDEPELGLHPAALDVLAEMLKSVARHNQVICSTQSVVFANHFEPQDFIVVDQERGVSTFKRLDPAGLAHWLEDYGTGDLWAKNLIGGRPEW